MTLRVNIKQGNMRKHFLGAAEGKKEEEETRYVAAAAVAAGI